MLNAVKHLARTVVNILRVLLHARCFTALSITASR
jgi:hypothetical protein